jgi:hypothetical protein
MSNVTVLRTSSGRFSPGQSGNPTGRPKGARNRTTVLAEVLREGEAEAIREKLVDGALAGDRVLLKFCASLLFAKPGPRPVELDLAPGQETDPLAILAAATRAMADGEIAPSEAVQIARVVNATARLLLDRAEARLAETQGGERKEAAPATDDEEEAEASASAPVFRLYPASGDAARRLPVLRLYPRPSRRAMLLGTASIGALEIGCGGQLAEAPDRPGSGDELDAREILVLDAALGALAA